MIKNAIRVVGLDDCAKTKGIHFEQSLSDARALVPDLDCHTAQYDQTRKLLFALASWCERYTPLVAISNAHHVKGDYGLFMDISGCAHLFGGEQAMVVEIKTRLLTQGFQVRLALADTPGAAWAMARYGNGQIIKNDKHPEIIADLPLPVFVSPSKQSQPFRGLD